MAVQGTMMMNVSLFLSLRHLLLTPPTNHRTNEPLLIVSYRNQWPITVIIINRSSYTESLIQSLFLQSSHLWRLVTCRGEEKRELQAGICPTFANFRFLAVAQIYLVKVPSFLPSFRSLSPPCPRFFNCGFCCCSAVRTKDI